MPGLVGIITKRPREVAEAELRRMIATMQHEHFYTCGSWANPQLGVYVGWILRRGEFAEGVPAHTEDGGTTLVFCGEEFPAPETIRSLQSRGHQVREGGASYLVHRYEEENDFPKQLNGRFHGLLCDTGKRRVLLFNDRYGLQKLYIHEGADSFYFAAEAKAILSVRPELRSIDPRGLGEFAVCGCVLENRTLFRGVELLPPGSGWRFEASHRPLRSPYFDPAEWENQEPLSSEEYFPAVRDAFATSLPRYFGGGEKVGVSLTGGLDTRIIMAWHKAAPGSVPCYTFGSMYRENQDVKLARQVAQLCDQPHEVLTTGPEFLKRFPYYAERSVWMTDASVDLSRSPDLYVNERAREIAPIRIVGTFGSEILLGATMFKAVLPAAGLYQREFAPEFHRAVATYEAIRQGNQSTFVAFRQSPWYQCGLLGLEQTQVAVRTPYLDNDLVQTVYRAPRSPHINEHVRLKLIQTGDARLAGLRTDLGNCGLNGAILRALLVFSFKAEYAYDYGMPQWLARLDHVLRAVHFERLWVGRHKIFHFRPWYREHLADYVRSILLDPQSLARPYLNRSAVQRIVAGHLSGTHNYTLEIHRLLTLELAHRLFLGANESNHDDTPALSEAASAAIA